jgi:hypothetical protein
MYWQLRCMLELTRNKSHEHVTTKRHNPSVTARRTSRLCGIDKARSVWRFWCTRTRQTGPGVTTRFYYGAILRSSFSRRYSHSHVIPQHKSQQLNADARVRIEYRCADEEKILSIQEATFASLDRCWLPLSGYHKNLQLWTSWWKLWAFSWEFRSFFGWITCQKWT